MDNQDQRRTHTLGHESHGVHVCHKCGWPFPNPHPSAKHRRAHKKICGTIEGYKLFVSEGQTHLNASDDERLSDDDHKTTGSNALDTGRNEKGDDGTKEKIIRAEDEVFSDAVADFSESGPSPGIKEPLQEDSLDSATSVEIVNIKDVKFSGSSEYNDFNEVSQLIAKSTDDCQIQNPKILQNERIEVESALELLGQLTGSTEHPLSSPIADLRTEESTVVHSDDCFGSSIDSHPSKAEAMPYELPGNKICAGENIRDCSLTSVSKETNFNEKDEIKADKDVVEIVVSSGNIVGETCEGVSKQALIDAVASDHQVADGAVNLKEKNSTEFLSVLPQDDLPSEVNSVVIANASMDYVQVESARVIQFVTSSDVKTPQGKGEGNVEVVMLPTCNDRPDVAHPQNEYEDFNDQEGVASQNPLSLHTSESLKHEEDDLKDTITEENNFLFRPRQLSEKSDGLFRDMHVLDSSMKEFVNGEPMAEEVHAEESIEASPEKLPVESNQRLDDMKTEVNESHGVHFYEEQGPDDICKSSEQISLPEDILMASLNKNSRDASLGSTTSETTSVICIENISHQEKNITEINNVAVDGKGGGANVENDIKTLLEKGEGYINIDALPIHDDRPNVAHPQSESEDVEDLEGMVSQNPLSLHTSGSLKHEDDDLKDTVTEENSFLFNASQLSEKSDSLSPDMHILDSSMKELVNNEPMTEEMHAEECTEVSPVKLAVESNQRLGDMKTEMTESPMVHFSEEQGPEDIHKSSQQISLPEGSFMASSKENPRDASLGSATSETTSAISIDNISHHKKNRTENQDIAVDGKGGGANFENDIGIKMKTLHPSDLLQLEVKQSSDLFKSVNAGEMGKIEKCDIADIQCSEGPIVRDDSLLKYASSHNESLIFSEVVMDESARKSKVIECTNIGPLSGAQEDIKEDEINSNIKEHEECRSTSDNSHQAQDAELLVKASEDLARMYSSLSSLNTEPYAQCGSSVEDNQDGEPGREMSGITAVSVQDQSDNNFVKLSSSGIDASVDSSSRCDSLEGNWGSISVLSMQSDAPAVTDAEALPSTGLLVLTEAWKSNLNNTKAASERQKSGKSEMLESSSFMTLVEPRHVVGPKAATSEVQKGQNPQQPNSASFQAGWFPTLSQVSSESQGRKKSEEIIAKVTNWSTSKQHTPLKSLLGEATHSNMPESPILEESLVNQKNGEVPEDNGSGLTTVNSILVPESPVPQAVTGESGKEWDSPARYPAHMKREKRKVKSRPYWIQLVCCLTVDPHRS